MQAQILQAGEAPSDPHTNNKLEERGRQSPLHLEKATLKKQTLGAFEFENPRNRGTSVLLGQWVKPRVGSKP
jgi:hypothetical protein